jgi:hypothetical protein
LKSSSIAQRNEVHVTEYDPTLAEDARVGLPAIGGRT